MENCAVERGVGGEGGGEEGVHSKGGGTIKGRIEMKGVCGLGCEGVERRGVQV